MATNIVNRTRDRYLQYEKRHQEILDAAIRVFNTKGYRGATTAEIAKTAGITEPILYKHFENKKDLFMKSCQLIFDHLFIENKKAYNKFPDDETRFITEAVKIYIDFLKKNPNKTMFMIHTLSITKEPEFEGFFKNLMERFVDTFEKTFISIKKKGKYKSKIKPRPLAVMFACQYLTAISAKILINPKDFTSNNFVQLSLDMLKLS
jgi:AcrR family transcriptional regulator